VEFGDEKIVLYEDSLSDQDILCFYLNSNLFDQSQKDDPEVSEIKAAFCGYKPAKVILENKSIQNGWINMPAKIELLDLQSDIFGRPYTPDTFRYYGTWNPSCQFDDVITGERGMDTDTGLKYSSTVDAKDGEFDAKFYAAKSVRNLPVPEGTTINARPCSSFVAYRFVSVGEPPNQVSYLKAWANGTGIARVNKVEREYQFRYFSGNPENSWSDKLCKVGLVPHADFFVEEFSKNDCSIKIIFEPE
jgi:hypothetical protein